MKDGRKQRVALLGSRLVIGIRMLVHSTTPTDKPAMPTVISHPTETSANDRLWFGIAIAAGMALRFTHYFSNRSFMLDEALLAQNVCARGFLELMQPLVYDQGCTTRVPVASEALYVGIRRYGICDAFSAARIEPDRLGTHRVRRSATLKSGGGDRFDSSIGRQPDDGLLRGGSETICARCNGLLTYPSRGGPVCGAASC